MRFTAAVLFVATMFVVACESTPDETGTAAGAGATVPRDAVVVADPRIDTAVLSPAQAEQEMVTIGDRVFFGFDEYDLTGDARVVLENQAALLVRNPPITVVIEGHADERGTREYNLALGERRATSVKNYLVALGVDARRIRTVSYGEERPAVIGSNESAWARNRRAVTVVSGTLAGS